MHKLTKKEFSEIDAKVLNFGKIQNLISKLNKENINDTFLNLGEFDEAYADFIAYSIIEICNLRINKDEIYGKLFHMLLMKKSNYLKMIDFIFKNSSSILRIVFDLGGIKKTEVEIRNVKKFPCFLKRYEFNNVNIEITKDLIYHKYKLGTIERAIFDNNEESLINQILIKTNKKWTDPITKSLFDNYDQNKLPTLAQFAFHCNSINAVKMILPEIRQLPDFGGVLDYAIMSGDDTGLKLLIEAGCHFHGKFMESAQFFNQYAIDMCEKNHEGTIVYNNIYTVYKYRDCVPDQVFDPIICNLIDNPVLNDVTKWLLCIHETSMYTESKYLSHSVEKNNNEITDFIYIQFPKVKYLFMGIFYDVSSEDDDDDEY